MDERLAGLVALRRVAAADAAGQGRREQLLQRAADVADQLDLGLVRGVDLGRLGVDVDDPLRAVRVPARRRVFHEVVADADDEVRAVEAREDVVAGLEAHGHQRQVGPVVDGALAHEGRGDRHVQAARQLAELRCRAAAQHTVAGEDDRTLGGVDEPRRVRDRLVGRLGQVDAARAERAGWIVGAQLRARDVLRQLDVRRPRLLEACHPEGLSHDLWDRREALDAGIPLGHGSEHVDDIDDLVGLLVEVLRARLAGDRDDRRPIEIGIRDPRQEVRGTGAERAHGHGSATGEAPVDVRHECRALLVPGRDVADRFASGEGLEEVQGLLARNGEDVLASLGLQARDEEVRSGSHGSFGHGRECTGLCASDRDGPIRAGSLQRCNGR